MACHAHSISHLDLPLQRAPTHAPSARHCPLIDDDIAPVADFGRVVAIDGVELQGQRLEEVIATLPQRGTHELEVVRVVVSSARRVSRRLSHEATSAPSMLAEKKPGHAKKASCAPSLSNAENEFDKCRGCYKFDKCRGCYIQEHSIPLSLN